MVIPKISNTSTSNPNPGWWTGSLASNNFKNWTVNAHEG